ncbi:MAG: hypothetical protein AB1631_10500 [Acidobacteriota bacterium]
MMSKHVLIVASVLSLIACQACRRDDSLIKAGDEIVSKVENFRKDRGRLPSSLSEIGIEEKEEGQIHYEKKSETRYLLWFGKELGESVVYDSDKKKWE